MKPRLFLALMLALALAVSTVPAFGADESPAEVQVIRSTDATEEVVPYLSGTDARNLPAAESWRPGDSIKEIPRRNNRQGTGGDDLSSFEPELPTRDPLVEQQEEADLIDARVFTSPTVNINGQGFTGVNPPDTVGDVGPNHYVQMINAGGGALVRVYDKSGAPMGGAFALDGLGGGPCASGLGDPIVLYDRAADRWMLSEFSAAANTLCVYVSATPDPQGAYFNYAFSTPNFPDYPKYAVWPDAYYVTSNESSPANYALDRNQMLAGAPATAIRVTAPSLGGFGFQALTPSDLDGATAPPAGSPNYFMRHRDDEKHNGGAAIPGQDFLEIWEAAVDFSAPSFTLTGPFNIPIAEIDSSICGCFSFSCFQQPSGLSPLDPLREVVMWRLQYRNFGTHETLVGNLVTDVGVNTGGIRWFELRKSGAAAWSLFQEGTYAPDSTNRWMGAISMDGDGNIALGYNVSSSSVSPGLRYVGRQSGDPAGTMTTAETTIIASSGSNNSIRYGDYSSMNVDPADDCTFWFTGEYNPAGNWATRIASFSFDSCGGPTGGLVCNPPVPGIAGQPNTFTLTGATPGGRVVLFGARNPGSFTLTNGSCAGTTFGLQSPRRIAVATADAAGNATFTWNVPGGLSGNTIYLQKFDRSSCGVSNVVPFTFP